MLHVLTYSVTRITDVLCIKVQVHTDQSTKTTTTRCSRLCVVRENTQTICGSERNSVLTSLNCPHLLSNKMTAQINSGDSDQFHSTDLASTLRAVHHHLAKLIISCMRRHVFDTSTRFSCLLLDAAQTSQASQSYTSAPLSLCIVNTFGPQRFAHQHRLARDFPRHLVQQPRQIQMSVTSVYFHAVKLRRVVVSPRFGPTPSVASFFAFFR